MRSGGGGSGGDCGFKSAPGAREPAGRPSAAAHPRRAEPRAGRSGQLAAGARAAARGGTRGGAGPRVGAEELCEKPGKLLRTSPRPLLEGPSSEDITSVWSVPHTHPLLNHGLYLCLPVFPVRPILWECLVGHSRVHSTLHGANGEDDKIQDFPGIFAFLPPDLQLHSLQSPLGQS
uniref:protein yippee-like 2 isoform X1 n=1 Tax=Panthera onca TaxID=9690 RepID=UPI002954A110|nr:protein yippee-like 2 isoform X1 [Panthera onca]